MGRLYISCAAFALGLGISNISAAADVPHSLRPTISGPVSIAGPTLLGTLAVPIRADRFDDSLRRAHEDASSSPQLQRFIAPARGLGRMQQIAYVQGVVSSNIKWESDTTQWGQHDYWASASQTLARGAGDMEDRAIVKMQALRALGWDANDLFLTLALDAVGGPETLLTVRFGPRYYVLDDTGGAPFPIEQRRYELKPIISFGWNGTWLHTRAPTSAVTASAAMTPTRPQVRR